VRDRYLEKR